MRLTLRVRWRGAWWAASSSVRRAGGWPTTSPAAPPSAPSSRGGRASQGGGAVPTPEMDYYFIYLAALSNDYPFTCMPNMLAAEAAAADGQKLLSPVAPAILRSVRGLWGRGGTKGPVVLIQ